MRVQFLSSYFDEDLEYSSIRFSSGAGFKIFLFSCRRYLVAEPFTTFFSLNEKGRLTIENDIYKFHLDII